MAIINGRNNLVANHTEAIVFFKTFEEELEWGRSMPSGESKKFILIKPYNKMPSISMKENTDPFRSGPTYLQPFKANRRYLKFEIFMADGVVYRTLNTFLAGPTFSPDDPNVEVLGFKEVRTYNQDNAHPAGILVISDKKEVYLTLRESPENTLLTDKTAFLLIGGVDNTAFGSSTAPGSNPIKLVTGVSFLAPGMLLNVNFSNDFAIKGAKLSINGTEYSFQNLSRNFRVPADGTLICMCEENNKLSILNDYSHEMAGYVIDLAFHLFYIGEAISVTCNKTDFFGQAYEAPTNLVVPESQRLSLDVPIGDAEYTVSCGETSFTISIPKEFGIYPLDFSRVPGEKFEDFTWAEIDAILKAGKIPPSWKIGDTKKILLSPGETLIAQIYAKEHDNLQAGGKAKLTLGLKNLMSEKKALDTGGIITDYIFADINTFLDRTLFRTFPDDLQAAIKPVIKFNVKGGVSPWFDYQIFKVFLIAETEVFGVTGEGLPDESQKYPIFTDTASRQKTLGPAGSVSSWWLRSPSKVRDFFCRVKDTGLVESGYPDDSSGICFAFCI